MGKASVTPRGPAVAIPSRESTNCYRHDGGDAQCLVMARAVCVTSLYKGQKKQATGEIQEARSLRLCGQSENGNPEQVPSPETTAKTSRAIMKTIMQDSLHHAAGPVSLSKLLHGRYE